MQADDPMSGDRNGMFELPPIQAKLEAMSPPPFAQYEDEDDGEEELEEDSADELPDDVDPNAGANFFQIREEDRVLDQRVTQRTVKELFSAYASFCGY
jgi:hypothetical protein